MSSDMEMSEFTFLKLGDAYHYGVELAKNIRIHIEGRAIFFPHEAGILAQMIYDARHSDHVEIGTLFGASAILAAVVKAEFGMHGQVHCIDPLERRSRILDDHTVGIKATSTIVKSNAKYYNVEDRIVLHLVRSEPWPLGDQVFGTGYIDGDHWGGQTMRDWLNMKQRVSYGIIIDDYCQGKPEVVETVLAAINDPDWTAVHIAGTMAFMRKRE
jgi:hypothetical protein